MSDVGCGKESGHTGGRHYNIIAHAPQDVDGRSVVNTIISAVSYVYKPHTAKVAAYMIIIGREKEKHILDNCYKSDKSEFVAIYGRRRVGKTFLIKEFFEEKFAFFSTGILNG